MRQRSAIQRPSPTPSGPVGRSTSVIEGEDPSRFPPSSHGRGKAAIRGTSSTLPIVLPPPAPPDDQPGEPRSPGCPLRGHRGMTEIEGVGARSGHAATRSFPLVGKVGQRKALRRKG